jgi:asparagine synthase (glutamine-hydrolysing)
MCGIFGILQYKQDNPPEESRLLETARLLQHRGPDNCVIYSDAHLGLVHARLSLLDLSERGNQPFWDKSDRYGLVFNGEIYNFKELRAGLERRGVAFRTNCDTEVLLEHIIHMGIEATLPQLEGMFAFGFYDKKEQTLILARDRFGTKPLFIYDEEDALIFSSEVKGMIPWLKTEPDWLSISSYLCGFSGPSKGHSFFKKIKILPPGTLVRIRRGQAARHERFFSMSDFFDPDAADQLKRLKPLQVIDRTEELLLESVKKQLFADAPVGALCSGGVDSSLVMAMAARHHNNLAIFHANVAGPLSEYEAASSLARHLKLDLKEAVINDQDFIDQIPEVIKHFGHPFDIIPSSVPFLAVSKVVRDNRVKAVLSGEGADESFLGYKFLVPNVLRWKRQPKTALKQFLKNLASFVRHQGSDNSISPGFVMGFSPYTSIAYHHSVKRRPPTPELVMGMLNRFEVALETEEIFTNVKTLKSSSCSADYMRSIDLLNYNLRVLLHRNDTMGMAASIESRFPFLDSSLVKFAVNTPYNLKIRFSPTAFDKNHYFFKSKWILRQIADRYLPKNLSQRSKGAFPVDAFQRLKISPDYFENSLVSDMLELSAREMKYVMENSDKSLKFKLLQLDCWAHVCLYNLSEETLNSKLKRYLQVTPWQAG